MPAHQYHFTTSGKVRPRYSRGRLILSFASLIILGAIGWQASHTTLLGMGPLFGTAAGAPSTPSVELHRTYLVAPGDTLNGIASRFGVTPSLLVSVNHLQHPNVITVGEKLIVPSAYHPSLTRQLITSTARTYHLDPFFAMALAYQESGFNENEVSPTGAIGVMQVEPGTADLVARDLGRSFDLGVERDNVTVGVYWLGYLVRYYGGHERSAAAAYYEGQENLAQHGYLAGTAQYVNDVMALRRRFSQG